MKWVEFSFSMLSKKNSIFHCQIGNPKFKMFCCDKCLNLIFMEQLMETSINFVTEMVQDEYNSNYKKKDKIVEKAITNIRKVYLSPNISVYVFND